MADRTWAKVEEAYDAAQYLMSTISEKLLLDSKVSAPGDAEFLKKNADNFTFMAVQLRRKKNKAWEERQE